SRSGTARSRSTSPSPARSISGRFRRASTSPRRGSIFRARSSRTTRRPASSTISAGPRRFSARPISVPPPPSPLRPHTRPRLATNAGPTPTHALLPGIPAIDHGNNDAGLATDQRGAGFARVAGARADIGAFEVQSAPPDPIFADGFDG